MDSLLKRGATAPPRAVFGSLAEDSALTGYLTAASGKTLVFSILSNRHLPGSAARTAIDRIVTAIIATN